MWYHVGRWSSHGLVIFTHHLLEVIGKTFFSDRRRAYEMTSPSRSSRDKFGKTVPLITSSVELQYQNVKNIGKFTVISFIIT